MKKIYLIGIGGIGMSALARYYKTQKWAVSGSDSTKSHITQSLIKEGINVKIGHKKGNLPTGVELVVYNRAIPGNNPEILIARARGILTLPYAKVLGEITRQYKTIAITGSHGKSTTTALAGLMLMKAGFDPTIFVGTNLKELGGKNLRVSRHPELVSGSQKQYLILEADDFGAAFLNYSPTISIVTNIDREHMDFYKNFANVKKSFLKFIARTREGGTLILNRDDKNLFSLKLKIDKIARGTKLSVVWYSAQNPNGKKLKRVLKIPGDHNISNAAAVYQLGKLLKISDKNILGAIGSYQGAWRRMEYRGESRIQKPESRILVYDDYAHHPTEIKATLQGFREKFPNPPLLCVFQPHQAKRLELLFADFVDSFKEADILILLPFYQVAGRDLVNKKYTSEKLVEAIKKKYPKKKVYYLDNPKRLKLFLQEMGFRDDRKKGSPIVIMMGAGDIVNYTDSLLS